MGWLGHLGFKFFVDGRPNTYASIPEALWILQIENYRNVVKRTEEILCRTPLIFRLQIQK